MRRKWVFLHPGTQSLFQSSRPLDHQLGMINWNARKTSSAFLSVKTFKIGRAISTITIEIWNLDRPLLLSL